jgi:hypothetical protein
MAQEDLRKAGSAVSLSQVKTIIHDHPEWEAKLNRPIFSDVNISRAMKWSDELFASDTMN